MSFWSSWIPSHCWFLCELVSIFRNLWTVRDGSSTPERVEVWIPSSQYFDIPRLYLNCASLESKLWTVSVGPFLIWGKELGHFFSFYFTNASLALFANGINWVDGLLSTIIMAILSIIICFFVIMFCRDMLVNDDEEKDELRVSKNIRVSLDFGLVR